MPCFVSFASRFTPNASRRSGGARISQRNTTTAAAEMARLIQKSVVERSKGTYGAPPAATGPGGEEGRVPPASLPIDQT